MNLDLDETQTLLRDTVRAYLEQEVPFERVRSVERERGWDEALWKALCRQGWLGLPFAEEHGGGGGSLVDAGLLVEEFARRAAIVPLLEVLVAGRVLERHAACERAKEVVTALLMGDALPVAAILEASDGFDEIALEVDGRGRLHGEKAFVEYGQLASHHLVAARSEGELALLLVEAARPEVCCEPLRSIGRTPLCAVRYQDAPAERVAGAEAFAALVREGRALAAVQCVGSMEQALEMTVRYACVREQFGKPIGSFQAVRHHCANMAIRVASARLLAFEALSALDAGRASDAQVAFAKASASRAVPEVTMLAHQIHGGNGVIEENDLYFFSLRGKESSLAWGSAEECLAVAAREVDAPKEWI
jgi:alkylation response protein AidB-like acyl-CoA dehydrogenase